MIVNNIIAVIGFALGAVIIIGILIRILKNIISQPRTVRAVVVNKQEYEQLITYKNQAPRKEKTYVVSFSYNGRKKDFYTSLYMYDRLHINQTGNLTFKGDMVIDFN